MGNSTIRAELETRLRTWADAQSPAIKIAFENMPFTKPTSGVFLETFLIPNITLNPTIDASRQRLMGIFQVNCWASSDNKGMKAAESLAQSVIDLFPVVPKTGSVSIERTPYASPSLLDNSGWRIVPVTIQYRLDI